MVFVTKLNSTGNGIIYSTYLGGITGDDSASDIVVDNLGNVYITGETSSSDFPIMNPYQTDQTDVDVFISKLNFSGDGLIYSTYLGGTSKDYGR